VSEFVVTDRAGSIRFNVHVQPRASRTEIGGIHGTALKVRLHSPPVEGAANDELIAFLAKSLGVAKRSVRIASGQSSRSKVVEVDGVSLASVRSLAEGAGIS
jgi:uncharacterized protein (TIGR00251 family)